MFTLALTMYILGALLMYINETSADTKTDFSVELVFVVLFWPLVIGCFTIMEIVKGIQDRFTGGK